jgi:hypothetical protein
MRILAISLSSRGFGFAVMEDGTTLVDWGIKSSKGDKNKDCLRQIKNMLELFHPSALVLEDAAAKGARRAERIQELTEQITTLAKGQKLRVKLFSQVKLMQQFFPVGGGTKHDLAVLLAARFPEELGLKLPPKRKPWQSEDARLDMFKAVALALVIQAEA